MTAQTLITGNKAIVHAYNRKYEITSNQFEFKRVIELIKTGKIRAAVTLINSSVKSSLTNATAGAVGSKTQIVGNSLEFRGKKMHQKFAEAYVLNRKHGLSVTALDLFFSNLDKNPSRISVDAFCNFLSACKMPITDRGTFLAYKRVNERFYDCHSNSFDNRPGRVNSMPRGDVDDNQSATCSTGFHVCNHSYLAYFSGANDMVVEINPKDVVAVPPDYELSKMRVCQYTVMCTLDKFKDIVKSNYQDVLGNLPCFNVSQLEGEDLSVD